MKISVVLATFNEEKNLPRCLASVKPFADEIIVVDGSSDDNTRQIAKNFGARVIKTINRPMFHTNKQMAIEAATGDWILQLDADEEVETKLAKEIVEIAKTGSSFSAFVIKRKNFFLGRWLRKGGQYPDPMIRFFKHGKARLPQKSVHEQMEVEGKIGKFDGHLLHYTAPTLNRYLTNANRYTTLTAEELYQKRVGISIFNTIHYMVLKPAVTFLSLYVRHKGWLDGLPGFLFALFSGLHWPLAYMKYWEAKHSTNHQQGKTR